jgi:hypothetical protein
MNSEGGGGDSSPTVVVGLRAARERETAHSGRVKSTGVRWPAAVPLQPELARPGVADEPWMDPPRRSWTGTATATATA